MTSEGRIESIRTRLLNLSRSRGESFDFVLVRYGVERFLYRLSRSDQGDRFILKGATLFQVWNRELHRPTRDLDLLGFGSDDAESMRRSMLAVLRVKCPEDGLAFDQESLLVEPSRDAMEYGGLRGGQASDVGGVPEQERAGATGLWSSRGTNPRGHGVDLDQVNSSFDLSLAKPA